MTGRYLLDTNAIIRLLNGDPAIQNAIDPDQEVFIPVVAVGELHFGAAKSGRAVANRAIIDGFVQTRVVLSCNLGVAREYGCAKGMLKVQGTPIPENDIWIAAIALHHGLIVVNRDAHFCWITELAVVNWQK